MKIFNIKSTSKIFQNKQEIKNWKAVWARTQPLISDVPLGTHRRRQIKFHKQYLCAKSERQNVTYQLGPFRLKGGPKKPIVHNINESAYSGWHHEVTVFMSYEDIIDMKVKFLTKNQ